MKALTNLLLPVFLLLCIACTNDKRIYRIGVSQCSEDNWRETLNNELKLEASLYDNIELSIHSVKDDSQKQIEKIEQFIEDRVDLLIVSPNESEALTPVISKAYDSGIPVILIDRRTSNDKYTAFLGGDNRQIGSQAANYASLSLNDGGKIFLVRGTFGSTADAERYDGFVSSLPEGMKIAGEIFCNFQQNTAFHYTLDLLYKGELGPEIDVIFAFNDAMALGVSKAYSEYRNSTKSEIQSPFILGVDALHGPDSGQQAIIDGLINASFVYPTGGAQAIELARRILLNIPYERENFLSTTAVDNKNVMILQLQTSQIMEQQKKLEELNSINSIREKKLHVFRRLSASLVIAILVCMMLLVIFFKLYSQTKKLSDKLASQNDMITKQVVELEFQKKQLTDISQKLEETMQAKLSFFTNISHEFKTPLSLISWPVSDILSSDKLEKESRSLLEIVYRNTSKLERLIVELLDFRSYEAGKVAFGYALGDLSDFLRNILKMFEDIVKRRSLTFEFDDNGKDYHIPFDPKKIEKIFTNLMSNAFNHVDKQGTIRVCLNRNESHLFLSVYNSGSFIPEEQREKIFRSFYTLDVNQKGTGIGLALVCSIVDQFNGTITVDSIEDFGTTFSISLPLLTDISTEYTLEENYVPVFAKTKLDTMVEEAMTEDFIFDERGANKQVVLVIEDNIDMRQYIKTILSTDYNVLLAVNGEVGIAKAIKYKPAIIISDILMPIKDGYEVCNTLKSNKVTENIPIILLTACSFDDQRAKGYECGADAYILKPFNVKVLKTRISKLLDRSRAVSAAIKGEWLIGSDPDKTSRESYELLDKIRQYVDDHLDDEIKIESLSAYLGMSKSKFYRELKEVTEYSPIDLTNMIKLKKAIDLMTYQDKNISQAAFSSGFTSPSYFSRLFQKYYHETPRDYIRRTTSIK